MAFQSVIMLMVLTRVCDVVSAGVFTIAYANANLFLNLGKYGMRNFQVSDVRDRFSFATYVRSRIITCAAMVVASSAYLAYSAVTVGYSWDKVAVVFVMTLFKVVDAVEDVLHGNYQQYGRLDVGAKVLTLRMLSTILVFAGSVVVMRDLLPALCVATVYTAVFFALETVWAQRRFSLPHIGGGVHHGTLATLLKECFPVFLAAFLLFYIGNAPKYAIDAHMDDVSQAYYGYIAMPVFVVGLLAGFIYNPIVASLAQAWSRGEKGVFARRFALQALIVVGLTVICVAGASLLGVPVLNVLYNAALEPYKADLLVLVAGGGLLGLVQLFTMGITIIRRQRQLTWGYVVVALLALVVSPQAVAAAGIDGASMIYFALMAVLALWFGIVFALGIKRS